MKRDTLWPFTELESLCLALILMVHAAFLLGFYVAVEAMR